jgi:hypothetical protein
MLTFSVVRTSLTSPVTVLYRQKQLNMPPRPLSFQPLKDFANSIIFYLSILPLALANPNVLRDPDSRREGKKMEEANDDEPESEKGGGSN